MHSLNRAARRGRESAIICLVKAGADLNIQDNCGQDALHVAAWNGHARAVETLIENGANVNAKDHEGQIALHKATDEGKQETVIQMAKNGAELHTRDNTGRSPVDLAIREGHDALKWLLLQNWVKNLEIDDYRRPALHQAVRYGNTAQVEQILLDGHNIDELDFWDRTALHEAARCGLLPMVHLLIDRGANVGIEGDVYYSISSRENVASLAADSCYLNWHGKRGDEVFKKAQRREDAIAIIKMVLKKLVTTEGAADGLSKSVGLLENKEKIGVAVAEMQDEDILLELVTKLILQEAAYRDSQRPRQGGFRFE